MSSSPSGAAFDAAVVGAGPAGSTVAALLARAGWRVALVEARPFPRDKVCGGFVGGSTREALAALGIGEAFDAIGGPPVRRVGLFAGRHTALRDCGPLGRAVERAEFDTLLYDRAVALGAVPFAERVRDPSRLRARLVIDAHGNPGRRAGPGDLVAFKTTLRRVRLQPDTMPLVGFPGGYGGLVAIGASRCSLSFCIRRDVLERLRREHPGRPAGEAMLEHAAAHCDALRAALAGAEGPRRWLASAPVRPGWRRPYRDGVFAIGNAAVEAHPAIADGIGMAIESARLLGALLLANPECLDDPARRNQIGRVYTRRLRARLGPRLAASNLIARLVMHPRYGPLGGRALAAAPLLLGAAARAAGKTTLPAPR